MRDLPTENLPGIDGIPAEFYKVFDFVTEWLFDIFKEAEKEKKLPQYMRTLVVKPLFKKGDIT